MIPRRYGRLGCGCGLVAAHLCFQVDFHEFSARRIVSTNTHGTGCTFSAAIVAGLAKGLTVVSAVGAAKKYVTLSLENAFPMGRGFGPLHHFFHTWRQE